jgi:hypothetical protein
MAHAERLGTPVFEPDQGEGSGWSARALTWAIRCLVGVVWISAAIFGLYIIAFFVRAAVNDALPDWNQSLPRLFDPAQPLATIGIGSHFATGAILLLLGPLQLMGSVRNTWPAFHRWTGRVYASAAFLAGVGGLVFIAFQGTIGGITMSVGFALYGALMVLAATETVRHAMARRIIEHRAWAIRLFALAIGSWLYRMDYGFWLPLANGLGHTRAFDGPFDAVMAFWFYLPNLVIAEIFIRSERRQAGWPVQLLGTVMLSAATGLVLVATYYFTVRRWGPPIVAMLSLQ